MCRLATSVRRLVRIHPILTGSIVGLLIAAVVVIGWDRVDPGSDVITLIIQ